MANLCIANAASNIDHASPESVDVTTRGFESRFPAACHRQSVNHYLGN